MNEENVSLQEKGFKTEMFLGGFLKMGVSILKYVRTIFNGSNNKTACFWLF